MAAATAAGIALIVWYSLSDRSATPDSGGDLRIAVALSGGGYRASLHGLATLKALEELGLLDNVAVISGVSGGSITAGFFAYRRAQQGNAFSFRSFEEELVAALSEYEVPRTVIAAELVSSGLSSVTSLRACASGQVTAWWLQPGGFNWRSAIAECAGLAEREIGEGSSLLGAIESYAGESCGSLGDLNAAVAECLQKGPVGPGAKLASLLVSVVLGVDVQRDMQSTFCRLKQRLCANPTAVTVLAEAAAGESEPSRHVFVDLLEVILFGRWQEDKAVRLSDLREGAPTLIVSAASNRDGALWMASQVGAGLAEGDSGGSEHKWLPHDTGDGPTLADAVAASTCHPLFCRSVKVGDGDSDLELVDGGVHDNLGLEAIRQHLRLHKQAIDLLIVADARRPYTYLERPPSRLDTIFRVHDMLIQQKSDSTLARLEEWAPDGCPSVHVSLSTAGDADQQLVGLPTDLRPIVGAAEMLARAAQRIHRTLRSNPCIAAESRRQLSSRRRSQASEAAADAVAQSR